MKLAESVFSLYTIDRLPMNIPSDSLVHYPKMKLGVEESMLYFSKMLASMAGDLIRYHSDLSDWVLTSPPLNNIYSGANWLCHYTYHLLKERGFENLSMIDIQVSKKKIYQVSKIPYSQMSTKERIASRQEGRQPLLHKDEFYQHPIIFINDINVTGSQQQFMESHFDSVSPAKVYWLYVINVNPSLGQAEPQLEYNLNTIRHSTFQEFSHLLFHEKMEYTGMCLRQLFSFSIEEFKQILLMLDQDRISKLLQLAIAEETEEWQEKLEILRANKYNPRS